MDFIREAEEPRPLRVRLANDFELIVEGLKAVLEPYAERVRIVETDVKGDADRTVDVTLYDTFGRTRESAQSLGDLLTDPTAGKVVVYSWNTNPALVAEVLMRGCRGYLEKSLSAKELVDRLELVAAGEIVSPVRDTSADDQEDPEQLGAWPGRHAGLSLREAEVITLITQGLTNPEIATRIFITLNSLKTYIRSAYRKMGVERRAQAVRWGLENGMVPAEKE